MLAARRFQSEQNRGTLESSASVSPAFFFFSLRDHSSSKEKGIRRTDRLNERQIRQLQLRDEPHVEVEWLRLADFDLREISVLRIEQEVLFGGDDGAGQF